MKRHILNFQQYNVRLINALCCEQTRRDPLKPKHASLLAFNHILQPAFLFVRALYYEFSAHPEAFSSHRKQSIRSHLQIKHKESFSHLFPASEKTDLISFSLQHRGLHKNTSIHYSPYWLVDNRHTASVFVQSSLRLDNSQAMQLYWTQSTCAS